MTLLGRRKYTLSGLGKVSGVREWCDLPDLRAHPDTKRESAQAPPGLRPSAAHPSGICAGRHTYPSVGMPSPGQDRLSGEDGSGQRTRSPPKLLGDSESG